MPTSSDAESERNADVVSTSVKMPKFKDGTFWTSTKFHLKLCLEHRWENDDLDIAEFMTDLNYDESSIDGGVVAEADKAIYLAISLAAEPGSSALSTIVAARFNTAKPQVKKHQGRKWFQLLDSLYTCEDKNASTLPGLQQKFFSMSKKRDETTQDYVDRMDTIVAQIRKKSLSLKLPGN